MGWEIVVVDVSEHPIERPKKTTAILFWEEEKTFLKKSSCGRSENRKHYLYKGR